jgi:hypothetical protein
VVHFANKPFDGNDMALLASIRWSGWGNSAARGHGTFHGNMKYTAPSTVVVSRPRRCSNGSRSLHPGVDHDPRDRQVLGPFAACRG